MGVNFGVPALVEHTYSSVKTSDFQVFLEVKLAKAQTHILHVPLTVSA